MERDRSSLQSPSAPYTGEPNERRGLRAFGAKSLQWSDFVPDHYEDRLAMPYLRKRWPMAVCEVCRRIASCRVEG